MEGGDGGPHRRAVIHALRPFMKLTHEDAGQLSVFTLKGDFTCDHLDLFQRTVDERFENQVRDFVIDVAGLEFIDSQGLEAMLALQDRCSDLLGQVRLAGAAGNLEQILRITRLASRFEQYPTVEEAVKSLRM